MRHILMVLSDVDESPRTVDFTLNLARKEGASVTALIVLDDKAAKRMASHLSDSGFVGDHPSQRVVRAIEDEFRNQGERILHQLKERFAKEGVPFRSELREGDFISTCLDVIREQKIDHAVVCGHHVSNLKRILLGSPVDDLLEQISFPVDVIDDEQKEG